MTAGPVVLFGLDGATYDILDDLIQRGLMPTLGKVLDHGARATLRSTIPPLTPPAWTTMVTGRSPGAHGIHNFVQFESDESQFVRWVDAKQVCCETIWSMVSRAGKRAGCLNFVAHHPAPPIDGYVVPGWVPWRWIKRSTHPSGLLDKLKNSIEGFDLKKLAMDFNEERKAVEGLELADYAPWIDLHIQREQQWFSILRHQIQHDHCDLHAIVFDGVDKLQHLVWHFLDPSLEPDNPSKEFLKTRDHCWAYFSRIDEYLAETLDLVGEDGHVLIVSDHGFTATRNVLYINTWLEAHGYLHWTSVAKLEPPESQLLGEARPYHLSHVDLTQSQAYAITASSNGIYIPVLGKRGAAHGVDPADYHRLRDAIIDDLMTNCRDPETGEALISRVWKREEIFEGPAFEKSPDLTVELADCGFFSVLRGSQILMRRPVPVGSHHPNGVFVIHGPGVRKGAKLEPLEMVDIAPTVLGMIGVEIPCDLEGSSCRSAFRTEHLAKMPCVIGARSVPPDHWKRQNDEEGDDSNSTEDESQILMRLKSLGYIE